MIYYSSKNEPLLADEFKYFEQGRNSVVFEKDGILLKVYKYNTEYKYHMKKNFFRYLQERNIPNLVKLIEYYQSNKERIYRMFPMDAYTMECIDGPNKKLLSADREYILLFLRQLEETLEKLSESKIIIEDSHRSNIIFNENGVSIIDLDSFWHSKIIYTKKEIYYLNKCRLLHSISSIIYGEAEKEHLVKSLKYIKWNRNTSLTDDFSIFLTEDTIGETVKKHNLTY